MTTFGDSSVSGFSPRRRSLLLGGIGGAATAALGALGHSGTAAADESGRSAAESVADFDLDTGNFIRDVISRFQPSHPLYEDIAAPMDVTIVQRYIHLSMVSWFDALAPYHPTAVGVYSRLGRRPSSESATNRNKNIAALHANYHVTKAMEPAWEPLFRELLTAVGLDPDDMSEDRTSPVGIGNLAGKAVAAATERDGMNQLGDEGRRYHRQPYADYTGYRPVNTAYELTHPSRWQPKLGSHQRRLGPGRGDKGIFTVQQFVTPQMRLTRAHTFDGPGRFGLAPPTHTDHTRRRAYRHAVDEVLDASATLTDERKLKNEFFDNKLLGVGLAGQVAADARGLDLDGWVHMLFAMSVSIYDALIAVWHYKAKYDSVRPFSAIRHVYGDRPVTAWGGPGVGTVDDLPADEWTSYLNVADHPEYPSASASICSAEAQAARRFFDDDTLDWTQPIPAGSSLVEPGATPGRDLSFHWATWTDFVHDCATSRLWGGVHFAKTSERSVPFGEQFGDLAYEYMRRHVDGDVGD
ncbi:vanadium-dependent haloperoxidase [Streptomyces sp. MAR4 CNX-425]|uniref:vanadium-dependent haloperoxidase n=1 Tax=Streptomyces sp. MAR4 CNX-425 TaxID=3406343 RepID=UPI003B511139